MQQKEIGKEYWSEETTGQPCHESLLGVIDEKSQDRETAESRVRKGVCSQEEESQETSQKATSLSLWRQSVSKTVEQGSTPCRFANQMSTNLLHWSTKNGILSSSEFVLHFFRW